MSKHTPGPWKVITRKNCVERAVAVSRRRLPVPKADRSVNSLPRLWDGVDANYYDIYTAKRNMKDIDFYRKRGGWIE